MEPAEILEKLSSTFQQEGVEVELLSHTGKKVEIRAKRIGPGIPVAFLVKAIEGTFKRYHSSIQEVVLSEYDPGENVPTPDTPSAQFEPVFKHRAPAVRQTIKETMGLDLAGLDRSEAIRALENAHRVWSGQKLDVFLVRGLDEQAAARAFEKWVHHYQAAKDLHDNVDATARVVHLQGQCQSRPTEASTGGWDCWTAPVMWMPGRVMLAS